MKYESTRGPGTRIPADELVSRLTQSYNRLVLARPIIPTLLEVLACDRDLGLEPLVSQPTLYRTLTPYIEESYPGLADRRLTDALAYACGIRAVTTST